MSSLLSDVKIQREITALERASIEFTNAFNKNRPTLAGFAKCADAAELHVVRDGFYLGLGSELCAAEYAPVKRAVVEDFRVAAAAGTAGGFRQTVESARGCEGWPALRDAVFAKAAYVDSDLETMWLALERGRLEWLAAAAGAHALKVTLRDAVAADGNGAGDVSDAKMVWIYALCRNVPATRDAAAAWAAACGMADPAQPLRGYAAAEWDPRRPEWRPLDVGAQDAADRGGANLEDAWRA